MCKWAGEVAASYHNRSLLIAQELVWCADSQNDRSLVAAALHNLGQARAALGQVQYRDTSYTATETLLQ